MSDDFAANRGVSALSSGEEVGLLDSLAPPNAFAPGSKGQAEDELDYDDLAPPSRHLNSPPQSTFPESPRPAAFDESVSRPLHDGLTIHVCRGAGDDGHMDGLLNALAQNGWTIDASPAPQSALAGVPGSGIEPGAQAFNDGNIHVVLGLGLGGSRAMWHGWDTRLRKVDGVVAVSPFLGFDSPLNRNSTKRIGRMQARAFTLSRHARWRVIAERIECDPGYTGLGNFVSQPISWADLADCAPHIEFSLLMGHLVCPTAIILDAEDPDLDAERALSQIPAMNVFATVDVRPLTGEGLVRAVEHGIYRVIRHHRESHSPEAATTMPRGDHPL